MVYRFQFQYTGRWVVQMHSSRHAFDAFSVNIGELRSHPDSPPFGFWSYTNQMCFYPDTLNTIAKAIQMIEEHVQHGTFFLEDALVLSD